MTNDTSAAVIRHWSFGVPWSLAGHWSFKDRGSLADQLIGVSQGVRCAGVGPVSLDERKPEPALLQIVSIDIGDFQFTAPAGLERLDHGKHVGRVNVNAGHRAIALRMQRFFFNIDDLVSAQLGDAVSARIGYTLERN